MRHTALLPDDQDLRWYLSFSFSLLWSPQRGALIDPVQLICATQPGVSHTSPMHVWLEGWHSWILISLTYCPVSDSCHSPQPRITEFWFVHETQNLEIVTRQVGDFQEIVRLALGNLGWSKKTTKNKLVNRSLDKRSESVNVRIKVNVNTLCLFVRTSTD